MTRLRSHLHYNNSGQPPRAEAESPPPGVVEVRARKPSDAGGEGEELFLGKAILIVSILGLLWIALISFFISRMPPE